LFAGRHAKKYRALGLRTRGSDYYSDEIPENDGAEIRRRPERRKRHGNAGGGGNQ